jgi:hypothetical protein
MNAPLPHGLNMAQIAALETARDYPLVYSARGHRFVTCGRRVTEVMARRLEFFGVVEIDTRKKPARLSLTELGVMCLMEWERMGR